MALMSDVFFNKKDADERVIASLIKELNRRSKMSKYFKDASDGKVYRATDFEVVTQEELDQHVRDLTIELADAASLLNDGPVNVSVLPVQADDTASDEPAAPAETETPATDEQPAPEATPAEVTQPEVPAQPEQPTETPAETPVASPADGVSEPVVVPPADDPAVQPGEPAPINLQ